MNELKIQRLLREQGFDKTVKDLELRTREEDGLYQFNYYIDSPKGEQAAEECRGLILNSNDNWSVVAYGFYRFYNREQEQAANIDYKKAIVQEKLDGSLMMLYYSPIIHQWQVATRGSIKATGPVNNDPNTTFKRLFWTTIENYHLFYISMLDKHCTYMFELTSPQNRVITPYDKPELHLLGVRNRETLEEIDYEWLKVLSTKIGIPLPKLYPLCDEEGINKMLSSFKATDEGFVVVDYTKRVNGSFPRVKIKNARYVTLHYLLDAGEEDFMSSKIVIDIIKKGETDEVLSYFPEFKPEFDKIFTRIEQIGSKIDKEFHMIKHITDRKPFAEEAKKGMVPGALFSLLDLKVVCGKDYIMDMKTPQLIKLLNS